jgi:transcriptional regulator with XRE-family HTH domain
LDDVSAKDSVRGSEQAFGGRLRARRRELGLTLKEVADGAGLSVGFISQIERGITTPSLSSLASVSRVLKVHLSEFLTQPAKTASPATRHGQRPHFAIGGNSLVYERLSASFPGNVLRTLIIHEPPGHRSEPISHDGEEIFYVLEGEITVEVGHETHRLEAGDSIHFPSKLVHSSWNHTDRASTILHTCTMDVFGDDAADAAPEAPVVRRINDRETPDRIHKKPKGN